MKMSFEKITVPILVVGFNRPHCIRKVMQQLATVKPTSVYFSIDAARTSRDGESDLVNQVKDIVKDVSWECDVHYRFFETNVGAEVNVSTGISWVLEDNDYVIVNEDDIYAGYAFYSFIQEMLFQYKDDKRIGLVTGLNLTPAPNTDVDDYYISRSGHIWGWGTWKRVWDNYSLYDEILDENVSVQKLKAYYGSTLIAKSSHKKLQRLKNLGKGNVTWDNMFWYHRIVNNYFAIVPNKNLVSNIGVEGLHAKGFAPCHFTDRCDDFCVSQYHDFVWNRDYDEKNFKKHSRTNIFSKIIKMVFDYFKVKYIRKNKITDDYLRTFYNS